MLEVRRRRGESFEAMLRRFSRRLQLSGKIKEAKKGRFYTGEKSKAELKKSALRRIELQRHYEKLKKLGKLPEEEKRRRR